MPGAGEFYNGEKPGIEGAVLGHVPGAHNLPFTTVRMREAS